MTKKRPWHRCFPVNFVKFLRTSFFIEYLRWLPLNDLIQECYIRLIIFINLAKQGEMIADNLVNFKYSLPGQTQFMHGLETL